MEKYKNNEMESDVKDWYEERMQVLKFYREQEMLENKINENLHILLNKKVKKF